MIKLISQQNCSSVASSHVTVESYHLGGYIMVYEMKYYLKENNDLFRKIESVPKTVYFLTTKILSVRRCERG